MTFKTTNNWWKTATGYQIYPRSFADSNGDGVGDIPGIISKLDYLQDLGIGFIWLSPVYRSPMRDNGYDISDYYDIAPEFGTLADMDQLIAEAGKRDIAIVMDLVVNHSSDQHEWFENAQCSQEAEYRDYYVWRDPATDGGLPNDLQSFFGGSAWTFHEPSGQYYLHLFDKTQPDLNWENPKLREEVYKMINWWLDRGIGGFRMDVIDLIAKQPDNGITADGPDLHALLHEMNSATLKGRSVVTVGETWSATLDNARLYCAENRNELSMIFQFSHINHGWHPEFGRYAANPVDLVALKANFNSLQQALADDGWNSLFWSNHDLPRAVSRYGDDKEYRVKSAQAIGLILHLMKGTPYIYQGEEIGMTNSHFEKIEDFNDVEIKSNWGVFQKQGMSEEAFLLGANEYSRDHARTPMHWTIAEHAGFTTGTPWLPVNTNYTEINVAKALCSEDSVLSFYKKLTRLRQSEADQINGSFRPLLEDHPQVWAYLRGDGVGQILVMGNVSGNAVTIERPAKFMKALQVLLSNSDTVIGAGESVELAPYEVFAARLRRGTDSR